MSYKYLGEAIALLGIAYSIFRWVARNAAESDRTGRGRIEIDLSQPSWPRRSSGAIPTPAPDPHLLEAAAAMFGVTPDALVAMDPRERALLLSGYRAARAADGDGRGTTGGA